MREPDPNEIVQYILVRDDLDMSVGKLMAQSGHAAEKTCNLVRTTATGFSTSGPWIRQWDENDYPKIVLAVDSEKELLKRYEALVKGGFICFLVRDVGRNEIAPSPTALGIEPMPRHIAKPFVKRLQTFKMRK